jgi:hypothetical protein
VVVDALQAQEDAYLQYQQEFPEEQFTKWDMAITLLETVFQQPKVTIHSCTKQVKTKNYWNFRSTWFSCIHTQVLW